MKVYYVLICLLTTTPFVYGQENDSIQFDLSDIEFEEDTIDLVNEIIHPIEPMPRFPGGYDSLKLFISQNLDWNQKKKTVAGRAFVEFIVNTDGSVTDVKIIKGLCSTCDKAAVEVVKKLPNFIPATYPDGSKTKVKMVMPIQFEL